MNNYNSVPDSLKGYIEDFITDSSSNGRTNAVKDLLQVIKEAVEDTGHYYQVCKHTCDLYSDDLKGQDLNPVNNLVKLRYEEITKGIAVSDAKDIAPDEC